MQMEIKLHHPLQITQKQTQKQTVTEKEIQQQDQEVCVHVEYIADFVMDMCTDRGRAANCLGECLIDLALEFRILPE